MAEASLGEELEVSEHQAGWILFNTILKPSLVEAHSSQPNGVGLFELEAHGSKAVS